MHSPLILLLFCPLVFSAAVSLSLSDFIGEAEVDHPRSCVDKAFPADTSTESNISMDEKMRIAQSVIEKCISDIALNNPKVKRVEQQFAKTLFDKFKFNFTELMPCRIKVSERLLRENNNNCTTGRNNPCEEILGINGCMIQFFDEYCEPGTSKKVHDLALFVDADMKTCLDEFFK